MYRLLLVILLFVSCATIPEGGHDPLPVKDHKLIIYNCDPSTAIGWVTWNSPEKKEYTSGDVDVYGGKVVIVIDVAKGDIIAITQFKWTSSTIVDYREVMIEDKETEVNFECEYKGGQRI